MYRFVALSALVNSVASAPLPASIKVDARKLPQTLRNLEDNELNFLSEFNVLYQNCLPSSNTITYKLCPSNADCKNGCENGGEYSVDFDEFLDAFTEIQLDAHEYRCEMIRENCEDDDAEACYEAAGYYDECYEQQENDEEFQLQEYLGGCVQYQGYDIWVKPYCADTINIYLGVFADEDCEEAYDTENWDADENGEFPTIPYSEATGESIIYKQCASCKEHGQDKDQNGGDDQEDEDEVIEQCEQLYEDRTYACETGEMYTNSNGLYADESGCEEISNLQKAEENFTAQLSSRTTSRQTAVFYGVFIAAVVAVAAVAGVGYHAYNKKKDVAVVETKPNKASLL